MLRGSKLTLCPEAVLLEAQSASQVPVGRGQVETALCIQIHLSNPWVGIYTFQELISHWPVSLQEVNLNLQSLGL